MINAFLNLPRFYKRMISVASDVVVLTLALWVSFGLRFVEFWVPSLEHVMVFSATVVTTVVIFGRMGLYRAVVRFLNDRAFMTIVGCVIASALALVVYGYFFQVQVPRTVPVVYGALAFIFVAGSRMGVRLLVQAPAQRNKIRVAIVGTGDTGRQLASALSHGTEYRPVLFITANSANHRSTINGIPVFDIRHVQKGVARYDVSRVLLALDEDALGDRREILEKLEPVNVPVQTVPSVSELVSGKARINDIRDLEIEDLLGREPVRPDPQLVEATLKGKSVMVTGAGGSIGSELCRQILRHKPKRLVLFEQSEYGLYAIERELKSSNIVGNYGVELHPILGSVTHRRRCEAVMKAFDINIVYHAAAYKHVPLVEHNIIEGVQNNVFGTWHTAEAAIAAGVERFVLVSTDKAVRPTNVMGASKRLAELVLQGLAGRQNGTVFSMVRFGNVLGSSGSVVPLFRDQIRDGGPVTVTHQDIIRYFMTIPEASQLVLQAGAMGQGGEVFVLDMGEPVKIADLARKMIRLMGLTEKTEENPAGDIEITYTGLRPGEKLFEELLIGDNPQGTSHPRVMMAREVSLQWEEVSKLLDRLALASQNFDCERILELIHSAPTGYTPNGDVADLVWCHRIKTVGGTREGDDGKIRVIY
ncbi:polysaccharide biosynthesis protein [Marinobacter pelagius]|uniref:NDP-sugar epimerase, includes UDP-GlcNAc-inverting 4,6-dehydratase FlaA1 and capsular polysaccharide biosynthesis protein EpsC n=1 Tax=Marinobacter pelagius TaxID=379482 RepID=A0A1I4U0U0_9GAMM|nr:nucleoside-diphosphate sugar epimerase/dehydratase [Marinobacter pelagius]SFM82505.1 NDP-sugar epimerase, includes UDP-GlcNAc-inverting 4,6-dehydratase FlaA1 and capsular polysaccharide biosynthesis protein EpsC [Marinobacter pelagius]